jgi:hypothetical protein
MASSAVECNRRRVVDEHRRRRIADAIIAGYRAQPQAPGEAGWSDEATVAMIADEPW